MCQIFGRIFLWLSGSISFSNWIEIIKIFGAALAFMVGPRQYNKSQIWKRLEFVGSEMKAFYDDVAVRSAMTMLDWRKKEMALFKYRDEEDNAKVEVNYETVAAALGTKPEARYDKTQSAI
jgi:hypothetical protein